MDCEWRDGSSGPQSEENISAVGLVTPVGDDVLLIAPLSGPNGTQGLMTLIPVRHEVLTAQHEDTLKALLEPLGVALENDRRVHELAILREAAEADRRSLLTRLGRKEMNRYGHWRRFGAAECDASNQPVFAGRWCRF